MLFNTNFINMPFYYIILPMPDFFLDFIKVWNGTNASAEQLPLKWKGILMDDFLQVL